ncbi:MAG: YraN family protein [Planctomycetota bacterium]
MLKNLLRKLLGDRGEKAAVSFLRAQGYRIAAKQYRNQFGEIDIIAEDQKTTVFIEVKTRSSDSAGQPFEAVDRRRQDRMTRAALAWLKRHRRLERPARFDVISILWPEDSSAPQISHFRNAFEATGRGQLFN